jgi:spore coat polysaccharide biosynthesis protein SpsF
MKTTAIIQARMQASRLPGKVLLDIAGQPMLTNVIERTSRAKSVNQVIVATTTDASDDPVEALCQMQGVFCYRGSMYDVLDRYYQASRACNTDVIVRITADCPIIDPSVIDKTVYTFLGTTNAISNSLFSLPYDFVANRLPPPWKRTYPIGLDTEVCSSEGLALAWTEARLPHQREHVMPFFYEQPERFRILLVNHDLDYGSLRWTVDTPEDLELVRQIFGYFPGRNDFSWLEVLALFERHPELAEINRRILHKNYLDIDTRNRRESSSGT